MNKKIGIIMIMLSMIIASFTVVTTTPQVKAATIYKPDLTVTEVYVYEALQNNYWWVRVKVKNIGSLDADAFHTKLILWSHYTGYPPSVAYIPLTEFYYSNGCDQGQTITKYYRFYYGIDPYYHAQIQAIADYYDVIDELNEDNNVGWSNWFPW